MAYNQIYSNYTPRKQSFGPVPLAGGNPGGGGWQQGGLNTGGSAFTLGQSDNQQPQGSAVNLVGGGTATPENYLGDWVPEPRRKMLSQIGFGNGAGSELLSLRKQYNAEKNNYAKQDLMSKMVNAETRFNRELQGQEQEYRSLARDANYAGARKMVNEETAAGRGEGLAAMAGNAILSNNHFSHGIINQGRMVAPAGNAVEDALKAYQMTGRTPNQSLLQMLAVSDALSQDDYMPSGPFGLNKSLGSYKSMSDVGQAGGMKVFGYDDAFGGSGKQAAIQDSFDILRDNKWQNDAKNSYIKSISNTQPVGDYKGPSQEYLANIKGWNKHANNAPDAFAQQPSGEPWQNQYATSLDPKKWTTALGKDEAKYQSWAKQQGLNPNDNTYDMRGYYKDVVKKGKNNSQKSAFDGQTHYPDTYKTPLHESFSRESKYAKKDAPQWRGDAENGYQLVDKNGTVLKDEMLPRRGNLDESPRGKLINDLAGYGLPDDFSKWDLGTLQAASRLVSGKGSKADQQLVDMPRQEPLWDEPPNPLAAPKLQPGQYETWVPPAAGMDPEVMYGAPKFDPVANRNLAQTIAGATRSAIDPALAGLATWKGLIPQTKAKAMGDMTYPALPAAFGIAEAPPLKKVEAKNLASPKGDIFDQQLFGTQSYGSPDVRNYEKDNAPAARGDNAFRHAPVGPVEAGQIDAAMSGPWLNRSQDPRHRAVVNGFKQLKIKNPPMAQFLARAYM